MTIRFPQPPTPRLGQLFTGQWADLPLTQLAPLAKRMGYDGLELACWGDCFDVDAAATSDRYSLPATRYSLLPTP